MEYQRVTLLILAVFVHVLHGQLDTNLRYELYEESNLNSTIAQIMRDSGLAETQSQEVLKGLQFRFLSEAQANISLEANTGRLFTNGRVDREAICPKQNVCEVQLDIAVRSSSNFFEIIKVSITIIDINDNQPIFPEPTFALSILESAALESTFPLPTARDNDSPEFGVQRYDLVPDSPKSKFSIRVNTKLDGSSDVRLILKKKLDRETRDQYDLQLVAYDGGVSPMSGALNIVIKVLDSNDNDPIFSESSYEVTVLENTSPSTMIVQVQATDLDDGPNGKVVYDFSLQTQSNYGHLFGIDGDNGKVFVKGVIDYEESAIYHLVVTAHDLGPDSFPTDTTVVVHVQDINDNPPEISINTLTAIATDEADIAEDSQLGTFVAYVSVKDKDDGRNGMVNCTIEDLDFTLEQRYPKEYQIMTAAHFDRETTPEYKIKLVCKDQGMKPLVTEKTLLIKVTDVNDNSPEFTSDLYTGSIIENNFLGASILQVNATDRDEGNNAKIIYNIYGNDADPFEINSMGRVYAIKSINREKQDKYRFNVSATDSGNPRLKASAEIEIHVEDANDEAPKFTEAGYIFSISENLNAGERVGTVSAEDKDNPPLNEHQFSLMPGRGSETHFDLDPQTGIIRTRIPLDREEKSVYYLEARVSDTHQPSHSSTATITIYVIDSNDNAPVFKFPNRFNDSVHVSNMLPPGYLVTTVSATDEDSKTKNNGLVVYSIKAESNIDNIFTMNPNNGSITVNKILSDVSYKVYNLQVVAKDKGVPQMSTVASLNIIVNKAIPFKQVDTPATRVSKIGHNFILVISLSCGCALIAIILVIAIIMLKRKDRSKRLHKYNCRMEALRMLTAKETLVPEDASPSKKHHSNGKINNGGNSSQYEQVPKEVRDCFSLFFFYLSVSGASSHRAD